MGGTSHAGRLLSAYGPLHDGSADPSRPKGPAHGALTPQARALAGTTPTGSRPRGSGPLHGSGAGRPPAPAAAIERVQEVHLHLHGVSAEDVAAIIGQQQQPAARPAIEEDCQRFACRVYREGYRDG